VVLDFVEVAQVGVWKHYRVDVLEIVLCGSVSLQEAMRSRVDVPWAIACRRDCISFTKSLVCISALSCHMRCSAYSPYAGTALRLLEAEGHVGAILLGPYYECVYRG
jgi:hypothetical protein